MLRDRQGPSLRPPAAQDLGRCASWAGAANTAQVNIGTVVA
jgi:hypothetical protein